ncbi:MAG: hypothetical protein ACRD96_10760, partial [Bryobacteraceae bacterium]
LNASLVRVGTLEAGTGQSSGFAFVDNFGIRTTTPGPSDPGVIQRVDFALGRSVRPTRLAESPTTELKLDGLQTSAPLTAFTRTLAPLLNRNALISLSRSGFTVIPWNYDAAVPVPRLNRLVNAADNTRPVAPGGLITVEGSNLSPTNIATREIPLPTALADSCLTVNGTAIPLVFVSETRINGQLPFNIDGTAQMVLKTPGGVSDNLHFVIQTNAPSVFRNAGESGSPVITNNNGLVSAENPVRAGDTLVIYATGLGRVTPTVGDGMPGPMDPLANAITLPDVTLGDASMVVNFAGLAPGEVGVYVINAYVPDGVVAGNNVPLKIKQGSGETTVNVRVAE